VVRHLDVAASIGDDHDIAMSASSDPVLPGAADGHSLANCCTAWVTDPTNSMQCTQQILHAGGDRLWPRNLDCHLGQGSIPAPKYPRPAEIVGYVTQDQFIVRPQHK
jgi:hypothetical protein